MCLPMLRAVVVMDDTSMQLNMRYDSASSRGGEPTMSSGQRPVERLAVALRDCVEPPGREERTARLAGALQDCFDAAVRTGVQEVKDEFGTRFDKQDATLRLMWKQMKGNGKLPIDD